MNKKNFYARKIFIKQKHFQIENIDFFVIFTKYANIVKKIVKSEIKIKVKRNYISIILDRKTGHSV